MKENNISTKTTKAGKKPTGPLAGIRVIDLSMLLPGPLCSQHLGDMGADVIKIENPRVPDMVRLVGPYLTAKSDSQKKESKSRNTESDKQENKKENIQESGTFLALNRNKRSITLNIKRPEGRELLLRLLENADILIEGFRPGTMDELGIGYAALSQKFPRLIYCAISGYGADGPFRDLAGHDANYMAYSGLLDMLRPDSDSLPVLPAFQFADVVGGSLTALSAILAALYAREKNGEGQFLDISMMDGAFAAAPLQFGNFLATGSSPAPAREMLNGGLPNYSVYECKDGKAVVLAALEERFFKVFLKRAGREDILEGFDFKRDDPERLRPKLKELFLSRRREEWQELFSHPDCCLSPVLTLEEAAASPQLQERGMLAEMEHPSLGTFVSPASPFRFSNTPCSVHRPPPAHGEHTDEVLEEIGIGPEERQALRKRRAI